MDMRIADLRFRKRLTRLGFHPHPYPLVSRERGGQGVAYLASFEVGGAFFEKGLAGLLGVL